LRGDGHWRSVRRWNGQRLGGDWLSDLSPHASADEHPKEKNDDGDDRSCHEQEHELFAVQLNLVKAFVCGH
jgi:hypothetical protein